MLNHPAIVYLIGAGPGDPKLITLRGIECLQKAEVVIYDRLVNPRILTYVSPEAECIYVGKGPDCHTLRQEEINELLIQKALDGKIVARLKGGDPFVFGRGGEEAEALVEAGIVFEIIPGITSSIAVPAYAGIPVTHRDYTSTLTIVTGHEDPLKEDSRIAWDHLAALSGTSIFLMGMENLPQIVEKLLQNQKNPETPIALIRWGTRPEQQVLTGTLQTIIQQARDAKFTSPVVTVVGKVVEMREKLQWIEKRPLFGRRIAVTRSRAQASILSTLLEELGAEPWEFPTIEIQPVGDYTELDSHLDQLLQYQWIIFTSVNGVEAFFSRLWERNKDVRDLQGIRLVAIGPATGQALAKRGLITDYIPDEYRAEAISAGLANKIAPGDQVLLPRARLARPILPQMLQEFGAKVHEVVTYETVTAGSDAKSLHQLLEQKQLDAVTFTSSSTVENFMTLLRDKENIEEIEKINDTNSTAPNFLTQLEGVTIACIGPITADTARNLGLKVDIVAEEYTINGLVAALQAYYQDSKH